MPKVYNWQLGRRMEYPYEERHPEQQFAFVFNINRCIGCQTCSMACKSTWTFSKGQEYMWWNNVESKPYGGYPQNWDIKALQMLEETNPGKQVWDATKNGARRPYGAYEGLTMFEAAPRRIGPEGPLIALFGSRLEDRLPVVDPIRLAVALLGAVPHLATGVGLLQELQELHVPVLGIAAVGLGLHVVPPHELLAA